MVGLAAGRLGGFLGNNFEELLLGVDEGFPFLAGEFSQGATS